MENIGNVYEIPYSDTENDVKVRESLVENLRKSGYRVVVNDFFVGEIFDGDGGPFPQARILPEEVITRTKKNSRLNAFLTNYQSNGGSQ